MRQACRGCLCGRLGAFRGFYADGASGLTLAPSCQLGVLGDHVGFSCVPASSQLGLLGDRKGFSCVPASSQLGVLGDRVGFSCAPASSPWVCLGTVWGSCVSLCSGARWTQTDMCC